MKAGRDFGPSFFWILAGIPPPESTEPFQYYIVPSRDMAHNVSEAHELWLKTPGAKGQAHKDSKVRTVELPPRKTFSGWGISQYLNKWELIEEKLKAEQGGGHVR
jgi:hypothetical protein